MSATRKKAAPCALPPPIAASLLAWYDQNARVLPWRVPPQSQERPDPYRVWLSEVMLQQTTVTAVIPYFEEFVTRWPTVIALASAKIDDVLAAWAGLGYYSRARNLHSCAQAVMANYGGKFPEDLKVLVKLKGIGPYTAAAIAAIAFGQSVNVVDGNVERVMARLFAITDPLPKAKSLLAHIAAEHVPQNRAGDYAQALMDLGATICIPKAPRCGLCPLQGVCKAEKTGQAANYPYRSAKAERPVRRAAILLLHDKDGRFYLQKRPPEGLLGGMLDFPSTPWVVREDFPNATEIAVWIKNLSIKGLSNAHSLTLHNQTVRHIFTHFELQLQVYSASIRGRGTEGLWLTAAEARAAALPSVMDKVLAMRVEP